MQKSGTWQSQKCSEGHWPKFCDWRTFWRALLKGPINGSLVVAETHVAIAQVHYCLKVRIAFYRPMYSDWAYVNWSDKSNGYDRKLASFQSWPQVICTPASMPLFAHMIKLLHSTQPSCTVDNIQIQSWWHCHLRLILKRHPRLFHWHCSERHCVEESPILLTAVLRLTDIIPKAWSKLHLRSDACTWESRIMQKWHVYFHNLL